MPQLPEVAVELRVPLTHSWSSNSHKISSWFTALGSKRGRRKAAAVAAAAAVATTRSFTLGTRPSLSLSLFRLITLDYDTAHTHTRPRTRHDDSFSGDNGHRS